MSEPNEIQRNPIVFSVDLGRNFEVLTQLDLDLKKMNVPAELALLMRQRIISHSLDLAFLGQTQEQLLKMQGRIAELKDLLGLIFG